MQEPPLPPLTMTGLGAAFAGVAAGSAGVIFDSPYGAALGVALSMPFFVQLGYGFGTLDREAYFRDRDGATVALDAVLLVAAAALAGALAATLAIRLDAGQAVAVGLATAGAFASGGTVYLMLTVDYHDEATFLGE